MWVRLQDETETLQRETGDHWSGWEYVGKIQRRHLGGAKSHPLCGQWFHSLLSVSEKAFSSEILEEIHTHLRFEYCRANQNIFPGIKYLHKPLASRLAAR